MPRDASLDVPALGCHPTRHLTAVEAPIVPAPAIAPVIPMRSWRKNRLVPVTEPRLPEPASLYSLVVLALVLHVPVTDGSICGQCAEGWPCGQARLAFRLREAF
jgi:hypothetical protein